MTAGALVAIAAAILGWWAWPRPTSATVLYTGTAHFVLAVTADDPRIGMSDVEIALTARNSGGARPPVEAVRIQAVMPLMGYATQPVTASPITEGNSRFRAGELPLMVTGPWELLVAINFPGGADYVTLPFWVSG
ncbi:MAG TPA: hypothetical protein VGO30_12580 [Mycobacterium sp.]|nr:hypothetical protein [Mycobacterium sp.]